MTLRPVSDVVLERTFVSYCTSAPSYISIHTLSSTSIKLTIHFPIFDANMHFQIQIASPNAVILQCRFIYNLRSVITNQCCPLSEVCQEVVGEDLLLLVLRLWLVDPAGKAAQVLVHLLSHQQWPLFMKHNLQ